MEKETATERIKVLFPDQWGIYALYTTNRDIKSSRKKRERERTQESAIIDAGRYKPP